MAKNSPRSIRSPRQAIAGITTLAAAAVLFITAVMTVLQGISALSDDRMLAGANYAYRFDTTIWGWIHIISGIVMAAVAIGLFWRAMWARVAAIIIASLSIVSMFMWLPYLPIWAGVVIALDVIVIWAVATWRHPHARDTGDTTAATNNLAAQHRPRSQWPEQAHGFSGFPAAATLGPMFDGQPIRLEDQMTDGRYEIRAELPGIDPAKDIDITSCDGVLTIKAERNQTTESNGRTEFTYGSFLRTVSLPPGADENDIAASYDRGILTVSVGVPKPGPTEKRIHVQTGS